MLLISQGMIGYVIRQKIAPSPTCSLLLRVHDWQQATLGGYTIRISAERHGNGNNPGFDIEGASAEIHALVDDQGTIVLLSDRPVRGRICIRRQSWQRLQAGGGKRTVQSASDRTV